MTTITGAAERMIVKAAQSRGRKAVCWTAAVLWTMAIGASVPAISAESGGAKRVESGGVATSATITMATLQKAPADMPGYTAQDTDAATAVPGDGEAAAVPRPAPLPPTLVLSADLGAQRLTVVENGKVLHRWLISSGRSGFATQTGTFRPQWASRMWYSRQYEYAPMPHAVFFNRGAAFHATTAVRMLGRPASHGCIRLAPTNAELLFKLVHKHGYERTKIVVHNGAKSREPPIAKKSNPSREAKSVRPEARGDADRRAKSKLAARSGPAR